MPEKNPEAQRWGGPGSSHQDRTEPPPDPVVKDADDPDHQSKHTQVSGGGGEGDIHSGHAPGMKRDQQASSREKSRENDNRG